MKKSDKYIREYIKDISRLFEIAIEDLEESFYLKELVIINRRLVEYENEHGNDELRSVLNTLENEIDTYTEFTELTNTDILQETGHNFDENIANIIVAMIYISITRFISITDIRSAIKKQYIKFKSNSNIQTWILEAAEQDDPLATVLAGVGLEEIIYTIGYIPTEYIRYPDNIIDYITNKLRNYKLTDNMLKKSKLTGGKSIYNKISNMKLLNICLLNSILDSIRLKIMHMGDRKSLRLINAYDKEMYEILELLNKDKTYQFLTRDLQLIPYSAVYYKDEHLEYISGCFIMYKICKDILLGHPDIHRDLDKILNQISSDLGDKLRCNFHKIIQKPCVFTTIDGYYQVLKTGIPKYEELALGKVTQLYDDDDMDKIEKAFCNIKMEIFYKSFYHSLTADARHQEIYIDIVNSALEKAGIYDVTPDEYRSMFYKDNVVMSTLRRAIKQVVVGDTWEDTLLDTIRNVGKWENLKSFNVKLDLVGRDNTVGEADRIAMCILDGVFRTWYKLGLRYMLNANLTAEEIHDQLKDIVNDQFINTILYKDEETMLAILPDLVLQSILNRAQQIKNNYSYIDIAAIDDEDLGKMTMMEVAQLNYQIKRQLLAEIAEEDAQKKSSDT